MYGERESVHLKKREGYYPLFTVLSLDARLSNYRTSKALGSLDVDARYFTHRTSKEISVHLSDFGAGRSVRGSDSESRSYRRELIRNIFVGGAESAQGFGTSGGFSWSWILLKVFSIFFKRS